MFGYEPYTLLYEDFHLEEVRGYQDGDRVLDFKLRLLLMDVAHEPIEDIDVTVHTNVDIVKILGICDIFIKVFHMLEEQGAIAFEVFVGFLVFIADMNNNLIVRSLI